MKKGYVPSLHLPKGMPVSQYETLDEINAAVKGDVTQTVAIVNLYLRQKGPLVEGRKLLVKHCTETLKFARNTKAEKKTIAGKETTVHTPTETEADFLDRLVSTTIAGKFTIPGVTLTGNDEQKEAAVWVYLQSVVDKFDLKVDAAKAEAAEKKPAFDKLPKYAQNAATNIIKNGTQKKWADTFAKEVISFENFQVANDPDGNKLRLALAVKAREDAKEKPDYA